MKPKIEGSYGRLTAKQVEDFELRKGIAFPARYRQFLLEYNGGSPMPDRFAVPGWHGGFSGVNRFFGIHDGEYNNLEQEMDDYEDRLPAGLVPIASDPGGTLVCIGIAGEHSGRIYFWDHEDELDDDGDSKMDFSNVYLVARDLDEFLNNLDDPGA